MYSPEINKIIESYLKKIERLEKENHDLKEKIHRNNEINETHVNELIKQIEHGSKQASRELGD